MPVNFLRPKSGKQRLFKENISYEHQYNSRNNPNYPVRGKVIRTGKCLCNLFLLRQEAYIGQPFMVLKGQT